LVQLLPSIWIIASATAYSHQLPDTKDAVFDLSSGMEPVHVQAQAVTDTLVPTR
jgi:hypothetical protein